MKNVWILVYEDVILSSAAAPLDIFTRTNAMLRAAGQAEAFNVELVGERRQNSLRNDPAQFLCQRTLAETPAKSDGHNRHLIVVPAFASDWDSVLNKNRHSIDWLQQHYRAGNEIASLCVGSYFLAEAGLLDGKPCTAHWHAIDDLRQRFAQLQLQPDTVITDQDGIYTGGGAFSSLSLILYLVEKFCGHDIGVQVSKNFSIHRDHINQAHFSVFKGLNQHGDQEILKAQNFIEDHYPDNISVDQTAELVNMSKRNFIRRFKQATQLTPLDYIQRVRIEAAKKALESPSPGHANNIQNLMYEVGYNDVKTFREVFKRITGVTPQDYRNKYGRQASL